MPLKRRLQAFQVEMLRADYGDFGRLPRYRALVDFFFSALYAPRDFGERNESFRSLHNWLADLVGRDPLRVLANAIELYDLTESLDDDMVLALRVLGMRDEVTQEAWDQAYHMVNRRMDRQRQVDLLVENGSLLEVAARVPLANLQLRAVRPAAALLGWANVVDFLLQGQEAMVAARPVAPLLQAIENRERGRIKRLLVAAGES